MQAANAACFQRRIQLSGLSAYPDGWPSRLIRFGGVVSYFCHGQLGQFTRDTKKRERMASEEWHVCF